MYAVELDQSKRLLVISAARRVTAEQVKAVAQRVRELVQDIAPGFRVLVDFRWLDLMDSAAAPHLAEIMEALTEKGVAYVARVMPDPHKDIGLNILSQFHYGPQIQIATFATLADALQSVAAKPDSPSA
jgi:anti-anti-sigma regulatory factor